MDERLSWIMDSVEGPVLPAMSLVPARMTTTLGLRANTSGLNRISIWGVVWPLIPRFMYGLPGKNWDGSWRPQPSVIESPMNTILSSFLAGAAALELASR